MEKQKIFILISREDTTILPVFATKSIEEAKEMLRENVNMAKGIIKENSEDEIISWITDDELTATVESLGSTYEFEIQEVEV